MVAFVLLSVLAILSGFVYALVREVVALAQNFDTIIEVLDQSVQIIMVRTYWLLDFLPTDTEDMLSGLVDGFMAWLQAEGAALADSVIVNTVNVTIRIGSGVVSVVIFIMACYFMTADYNSLTEKTRKLFSVIGYKNYGTLRDATLSALGRYLKAQLLMAFAVFIFSLIGLLIIRQDYALLLAFILGVLDFLPIVGTAIILVPWGVVSIITGSMGHGIYLISMSLVIFILRRIIEPKIVSSQTGLSPLIALSSIYVGMRLGGVLGLILGPIIAMVFVSLYRGGLMDGWVRDINAVLDLRKRKQHN